MGVSTSRTACANSLQLRACCLRAAGQLPQYHHRSRSRWPACAVSPCRPCHRWPMAAPPQRGAHTNAFSAATAAGTPQRGLPSDEEDGGSGRRRIRNAGHGKENVDYAVDAEAVARAIARLGRFLDFRERAASEISDKLKSLGYSDAGLRHSVLEKLQQIGVQDDARFAAAYVRSMWRTKATAPGRLAHELRSRGVAQTHIDAALATEFGTSGALPRGADEAACGEESDAWQHLLEVCRVRARLSEGEPAQKRRAKLAAFLQRRGHSISTAFRVFAELNL